MRFDRAVVLLAVAACRHDQPNYCATAPDHNCLDVIDAPRVADALDAPAGCTGDDGCGGAAPVCDLATDACVMCAGSDDALCTGTTPVCGSADTCRACAAHTDCASAACLPDGSCAADADVAYVDPAGTANASCTRALPCTTIAAALATARPYVKLHGTLDEAVTVNDQDVTWLADPGATLTYTTNGNIVVVEGTSHLAIYDLAITGASGTGVAVSIASGGSQQVTLVRAQVTSSAGGGIVATGGNLVVSRSVIASNPGGGIAVLAGATFDITNSFIYRNGDQDTGAYGGLDLGIATAGSNRLAFDTIVDNRAAINSGGVVCNVAAFAGPNNLIARNTLAGSAAASGAQTSGACTYPTSAIQNDTSGLAFVHGDATPFDYHLGAASAAIDHATTATGIAFDYDGDPRPQGSADDQGADELHP